MTIRGATWQQRFLIKIRQRGDCWEWRGTRVGGYGVFWRDGKNLKAHRVAFEMAKGPLPPDLTIDHLCRHPWCVRPSHLEAVPMVENVVRGDRANRHKTHCVNGHPFTELNTKRVENGWRHCRACDAAAHRAITRVRLGLPVDAVLRRGIRNGKLSLSTAAEIRALHKSGIMQKTLAHQYGVSRSLISLVCKNEVWKAA